MEWDRHASIRRAELVGRVIAVLIALPIYLSLLSTFPAFAAVLAMALYGGVPAVARRVAIDPSHQHATGQFG